MKYIREFVNERLKAVLHGCKRLVGGIEDVFKPVLRHNGLQLEADRGGDARYDVRMRVVSRLNCVLFSQRSRRKAAAIVDFPTLNSGCPVMHPFIPLGYF